MKLSDCGFPLQRFNDLASLNEQSGVEAAVLNRNNVTFIQICA